MILEAVCGIIEGLNPKLIHAKLEGFAHGEHPPKAKAAKKDEKQAGAGAPAEA